jgi:hypothetical protein
MLASGIYTRVVLRNSLSVARGFPWGVLAGATEYGGLGYSRLSTEVTKSRLRLFQNMATSRFASENDLGRAMAHLARLLSAHEQATYAAVTPCNHPSAVARCPPRMSDPRWRWHMARYNTRWILTARPCCSTSHLDSFEYFLLVVSCRPVKTSAPHGPESVQPPKRRCALSPAV